MNFQNFYSVVENEYNDDIAVLAVSAMSVLLTLKPKTKDFQQLGRFTNRFKKKTKKLLWSHSEDQIELAIKITLAWNDYKINHTFGKQHNNLKTLRELVDSGAGDISQNMSENG